MLFLYRLAPGQYALSDQPGGALRLLLSDPLRTPVDDWERGEAPASSAPLAPIVPGKIVGIGRNYKEHVKELNNPLPAEPVIFLKATSSLIGPGEAVVVPPESERVEHEGEIAVVVGARLKRASEAEARRSVLGITAACDVTARDLQRKDPTFARAKSFDTFCPLGPAVWIGADPEDLTVITRVNGIERQRGHTREMTWGIVDLLVYTSRMMTLEPGDVILTGTPAGVGPLVPGDRVEVEIPGLGVLANPVEALHLTGASHSGGRRRSGGLPGEKGEGGEEQQMDGSPGHETRKEQGEPGGEEEQGGGRAHERRGPREHWREKLSQAQP